MCVYVEFLQKHTLLNLLILAVHYAFLLNDRISSHYYALENNNRITVSRFNTRKIVVNTKTEKFGDSYHPNSNPRQNDTGRLDLQIACLYRNGTRDTRVLCSHSIRRYMYSHHKYALLERCSRYEHLHSSCFCKHPPRTKTCAVHGLGIAPLRSYKVHSRFLPDRHTRRDRMCNLRQS
jgi:hypothetical protein